MRIFNNTTTIYDNLTGRSVHVEYGNVEKALRVFKKVIEKSGVIADLRSREFYEKPTTARKRLKAAAKSLQRKLTASNSLPRKKNS